MFKKLINYFLLHEPGGQNQNTQENLQNLNTQTQDDTNIAKDPQNTPTPHKSQQMTDEMNIWVVWTKKYISYLKTQPIKGSFTPRYPTDEDIERLRVKSLEMWLNPIKNEIYLMVQFGDVVVFVGREGYRQVAHRHPRFELIEARGVYEWDEFITQEGRYTHHITTTNRGKLLFAFCAIKYKDSDRYAINTVPVEFLKTREENMKDVMLVKNAECAGIRWAFPDVFSGTYNEYEAFDNTKGDHKHKDKLAYNAQDVEGWKKKIRETQTLEELKTVFLAFNAQHKKEPFNDIQKSQITEEKDRQKEQLENEVQQPPQETPPTQKTEEINIFDTFRQAVHMCESLEEIQAVRKEMEAVRISETQKKVLDKIMTQKVQEIQEKPEQEPGMGDEQIKKMQDNLHYTITQAINKVMNIEELDRIYKNVDEHEKDGTLRQYHVDTLKKAIEARRKMITKTN